MEKFFDPLFDGDFASLKEIEDIYNIFMSFFCVVCAGLAAGLTMGLLSLDVTKLEIKRLTGSDLEKDAAAKILPIVKQHHLLLCTLLLFNSLANEALPIFLGYLVPNYIAIIISVTLVLLFGEIIPSAFFTGPNQLIVASKMTPLVWFLLLVLSPIAYPLSKALDYFIGDEEPTTLITRDEFEALILLQQQRVDSSSFPLSPLCQDEKASLTGGEVKIMSGILRLSQVTVREVLIPMSRVKALSDATRLDATNLQDILQSGFSRIPVFRRSDVQHITGYLLVKTLIVTNPEQSKTIEQYMAIGKVTLREPLFVSPDLGLLEMLHLFRDTRCHMALVSEDPVTALKCLRNNKSCGNQILGVVTLEDVIEEVINDEILDETDQNCLVTTFPYGGAPSVSNPYLQGQKPQRTKRVNRKLKPQKLTKYEYSLIESELKEKIRDQGERGRGSDRERSVELNSISLV